jgi:hypothetical protein
MATSFEEFRVAPLVIVDSLEGLQNVKIPIGTAATLSNIPGSVCFTDGAAGTLLIRRTDNSIKTVV